MAGREGGRKTMKRVFSLKFLQGRNCHCHPGHCHHHDHHENHQHAPSLPKKELREKNKCCLSLLWTESQQSHTSGFYIFTWSEIWTHTTAINFHSLHLCGLPRYVAQRGFLWAGLQLPGSHLHKEEILVHSVYLFCVEKSRAINHEEIHSTLFHFTLLSTTLYRVSEWIFNIMPQNALVFYHMLGLYQSDNTWEFWEILSTEEKQL